MTATLLAAPARKGGAAPKHKPKPRNKVPRVLNDTLANHDDRVLTFHEWINLNGISAQTGRRILNGERGVPPEVVQLSAKRVGITVRANREWQARRVRGA
jgi:hypothetical protein